MLMGARIGAWKGGSYDTRSYVRSGLVAMWDGLENAGYRTHDASATTWKDLAGVHNYDLGTMSAGDGELAYGEVSPTWGDNCWDGSAGGHIMCAAGAGTLLSPVASVNPNGTGEFTAECVFRIGASGKVTAGAFAFSNGIAGRFYGTAWGSSSWSAGGYHRPMIASAGTSLTGATTTLTTNTDFHVAISRGASSAMAEANGYTAAISNSTSISTSGRLGVGGYPGTTTPASWSSIGPAKCKVYAVRIYSRALTAAEIAANYAVDRARFGI